MGPCHPVRPPDKASTTSPKPSLRLTQKHSCRDVHIETFTCLCGFEYELSMGHAPNSRLLSFHHCSIASFFWSFRHLTSQVITLHVCGGSQVLSVRTANCGAGQSDGAQRPPRPPPGAGSALLPQQNPARRRQGSKRLAAFQRHVSSLLEFPGSLSCSLLAEPCQRLNYKKLKKSSIDLSLVCNMLASAVQLVQGTHPARFAWMCYPPCCHTSWPARGARCCCFHKHCLASFNSAVLLASTVLSCLLVNQPGRSLPCASHGSSEP